jgi:ribosomal protein S18 acetylase RimI-like enzyme
MRSPVYTPEQDIVVVAPDGRFAAFCVIWLDPVNRVGLFEPVGVHPEFQRHGLGKALVQDGLRRMQEQCMNSAIVCAVCDNPAAHGLYQSAGFRDLDILQTFQKGI